MKLLLILLLLAGYVTARDEALQKEVLDYAASQKLPQDTSGFNVIAHLPPINQDTTSSCWSFSTLSFMESEMLRVGKTAPRLAMMYPVYQGFIEKARRYVRTRGESRFAGGDLFSGVLDVVTQHGIVPLSAYQGDNRPHCSTYNHDALYDELDALMKTTKEQGQWDENLVLEKVRAILDRHMGAAPRLFDYDGQRHTPLSFLKLTGLKVEDFQAVTSFSYAPFDELAVLDVPDNWGRQQVYYNLPLERFYNLLIASLQAGYSAAIDADISETGRIPELDTHLIPPFDIPQEHINQQARDLRFANGATTDDHLMHIVGYKNIDGTDWFLVKDSWRNAWDGSHKGYFFMRGDYVKLKVLAFIVHKDALKTDHAITL